MSDEIDFLNQDSSNPAEQVLIENSAPQNPEVETFAAPNWDDIKSGKVNYNDLAPAMKTKVKREAYEDTPDDKKYLWDDYRFTPPETYHGIDKNGRKVQGYDLEGFEELVKKGKIPKTKVEEDVEKLTTLVKETNKTVLSQQERDIDKRISDLKESGVTSKEEFDNYEKLLGEKRDVKFQKLQLDKDSPKREEAKQPSVDQVFSLDEQAAIEVFKQNNKTFVDIMAVSPEMMKYFDEQGAFLQKRNPKASLQEIANAAKTITENRFNLNKQQRPMSRNIIQSEQKTNLNSQPTQKLTYGALSDRDKKWINSEARSGKPKYSGKSMDEITNMVYGHLLKK